VFTLRIFLLLQLWIDLVYVNGSSLVLNIASQLGAWAAVAINNANTGADDAC
jgi:hypothetical protein